MKRPICAECNQKHASVNYTYKNKRYYRKKCDSCIRKSKKIVPPAPNWVKAGYKKKLQCDKCKFKARWHSQLVVYYADGDLTNTKLINLKTICLNCVVIIEKGDMPWIKTS